jgi:general nucleoside transport system ATP-binding protein
LTFALQTIGISKRNSTGFSLDQVDFGLNKGEIHVLLGNDGAGKTTLLNILSGLCQPDSGQILLDGIPTRQSSPQAAIWRGIGLVPQQPRLNLNKTVVENILLNPDSPYRLSWLKFKLGRKGRRKAEDRICTLLDSLNWELDIYADVKNLLPGDQKRIEILKALYQDAEILLMDEPANTADGQETDDLFVFMRTFVFQGKSILFATNQIDLALQAADRVSVIRSGRLEATIFPGDTNRDATFQMMNGEAG